MIEHEALTAIELTTTTRSSPSSTYDDDRLGPTQDDATFCKLRAVFARLYSKLILWAVLVLSFWFSYVIVICNSTYFWSPKNSDKENPLQVHLCEPMIQKTVTLFSWPWHLEQDHSGYPMWPATVALTCLLILIPSLRLVVPISEEKENLPSLRLSSPSSGSLTRLTSWYGRGDPDMRFWSIFLLVVPIASVLLLLLWKPIPSDTRQAMHDDLVTMVFTQLITSWANPAGYGAVVSLSFFLVPVARQSPLLELLGVSPTLAVGFHIWAGRLCAILVTLHGILHTIVAAFNTNSPQKGMIQKVLFEMIPLERKCWRWQLPGGFLRREDEEPEDYCYHQWRNVNGVISAMALFVLVMTSWNVIRRRYYRFFYTSHVVCGALMMVFCILHFYWIAVYLMPGMLYYWVCLVPGILHQLNNCRHKTSGVWIRNCTGIPNSNGCFELQLATASQPRHHPAYIKLCMSEISMFEWHPFTVVAHASDGNNNSHNTVSLLIREYGPFTKALCQRLGDDNHPPPVLLVDGFYDSGPDWVQEALDQHDTSLFVAAGIGITPVLSVVLHLWKELSSTLEKNQVDIHIHWYCRDPTLVEHVFAHHLQPIFLEEDEEEEDHHQADLEHTGQGGAKKRYSTIHFAVHLTSGGSSNENQENGFHSDDNENGKTTREASSNTNHQQHCPNNADDGRVPFHASSTRATARLAALALVCTFAIHLWWYHEMSWQYRHRVFVRGYTIAVALAIPVFVFLLYYQVRTRLLASYSWPEHQLLLEEQCHVDDGESKFVARHPATMMMDDEGETNGNPVESPITSLSTPLVTKGVCRFTLEISHGRPPMSKVVMPVVESPVPAVFFCGPDGLWAELRRIVQEARRKQHCSPLRRRRCAWFKEHFEL